MRLQVSSGDVSSTHRDAFTSPEAILVRSASSRSTGGRGDVDSDDGCVGGGPAVGGRLGDRYKTELCRSFAETGGKCRYAERCQFAHGQRELRIVDRHPRYKTELCRTFHSRGFCAYGARCHFIHNVNETRPSQNDDEEASSPAQVTTDHQLSHPNCLSAKPEVVHTAILVPTLGSQRLIDHATSAGYQLLFSSPDRSKCHLSEKSFTSPGSNRGHQHLINVNVTGNVFPSPISNAVNDELFRSRSRSMSLGSAASRSMDSSYSDESSPGPSSPTNLGLTFSGPWKGFAARNLSDDMGPARWIDASYSPSFPESFTTFVGAASSLHWNRLDATADCFIAVSKQQHPASMRFFGAPFA